MEAFLISTSVVALAEMGDKTQLLSLVLAARFRKPLPIVLFLHGSGERGSDGFISPVFVRQVVDKIKERGGKPFLTDTNTLYSGSRHNAVEHLLTALEHGFDYTVTGAPIIIADGLHSENIAEVQIDKKHFAKVKLAKDIVSADSAIVLSHFKAHEMAGFGGAIKNLAMGGAPAIGKKEQHALKIVVNQEKCIGCKKCSAVCPELAITVSDKKASVPMSMVRSNSDTARKSAWVAAIMN